MEHREDCYFWSKERNRCINEHVVIELCFDECAHFRKENANSGYPLLGEVADEMNKAISQFPTLHSLHEGYAIMLEEVDELWEHVKMNQKRRDKEAIKKECIQIAAMALRIILDCGDMDK